MSARKAKRFWTEARAIRGAEGWEITLDGCQVRTPANAHFSLPTRALAEAVAAEWRSQGETIDPRAMPFTRASNVAIDRVAGNRAEVAAMLAAYGETDLLCHRAEAPAELARRQAEAWDPLLAWAEQTLSAPLSVTIGVIGVDQSRESLARLRAELDALDPFRLSAMHDLVALSGSLIIGLAALHRQSEPEALWQASRIDESWQESLWGRDEEAHASAEAKRRDFLLSAQLLRLLDPTE